MTNTNQMGEGQKEGSGCAIKAGSARGSGSAPVLCPGGATRASALPLAGSGCALPPSLETEQDSRARSAGGCLHVLSCFPG